MLYDLTSLQREANTRFGFSARRTLGAAQKLYEEHKALTYPRTSSRYLTTDMVPDLIPITERLAEQREYAVAAKYVQGLDSLPLTRVVNDEKVGDHHAIIPTDAVHPLDKMGDDERRIYDMVSRRFLAVFHPQAVFENTRVETTVEAKTAPSDEVIGHVFRTRGRVLIEAGWRGVYGELTEGEPRTMTTTARIRTCRSWRRARRPPSITSRRWRKKPSRRAATAMHRCSVPWKPRGSSSTTTRSART